MIWHRLFGHSPAAVRRAVHAAQDKLCGGSTLELIELEERILMSATPLAPDAMPDAEAAQVVDADDASAAAMPESPAGELPEAGEAPLSEAALSDAPTAQEAFVDGGPAADQPHEVAFVDTSVTDYEDLVNQLHEQHAANDDFAIILLDSQQDGIEQITRTLEQYEQLDAVHFLSHGSDGAVRLGNTWLNADTLTPYAGMIAGWSDALASDADLLFYSCNLAASPDGLALLEGVQALTGADVAASVDPTGHADLQGDWELECSLGVVESTELLAPAAQARWFHVMAGGYVGDDFETQGYAGHTGTPQWTGNWHEMGEADDAGSGSVRIVTADLGAGTTYCVRFNPTVGYGLYREVDLASASSATLSFTYDPINADGSTLRIEVSANGGTDWAWLEDIAGGESGVWDESYDITSYAAAHTQVRFSVVAGGGSAWLLDDVRIDFETSANSPPVLNAGGALTLADILEDQFDSGGTTVAGILTSAGGDRITDADVGALEGIAVIGADNTFGQWQYDAQADGTWLAFGAVNDHSAVLLSSNSLIRFVPQANFNGSPGVIQFRAWDQTQGGVGAVGYDASDPATDNSLSVATDAAGLTVQAVNDAPQLTVPSTQCVDEDGVLSISGLAVSDVDAGVAELQVTLIAAHGRFDLATTSGLTFWDGDGTNDTEMVLFGSLSDINAALTNLTYRPAAEYHGTDALAVMVNDLGGTGSGGSKVANANVDINVNAVNDAPQLILPVKVTADEDRTRSVNGLRVTDSDADDETMRVELAVDHGRLTLRDTDDLTFILGDGQSDRAMIVEGTLDDINDALDRLSYRGDADFNGTDSLRVTVNDLGNMGSGGARSASGSVEVLVDAVNDEPESEPNSFTIAGDQTLVVNSPGLLDNDTDIDGDTLSVYLVRGPRYGELDLNRDGSFTFKPHPGYVGTVSFTYVASDGDRYSDLTYVLIGVTVPTSPVEIGTDDGGNMQEPKNSDQAAPTSQAPSAPRPEIPFNLESLTSGQLPTSVGGDESRSESAGRDRQPPHEAEANSADMAAVTTGQGLWSTIVEETQELRSAVRSRSGDDVQSEQMSFVETTVLPTIQEIVHPVVTVAHHELADLTTILQDPDPLHRWVIGSAMGVTTGLTVGYVLWTVRAGYLLTGLIAQVPAWKFVDPLPILNSLDGTTGPTDSESLASIAEAGTGATG